jgi:threonine dehydrogenase-like Zn-dependent dehydrogenase
MAGICKTDIEISRGYMDFKGVPGHEFVGVVESSPEAHQIGTRVVGEINAGCGECLQCSQGMERHCPNRTVLGIAGRNGAFAEYLTLPAHNLVSVPETLPDEKAVFVEPFAAALEILEQMAVRPIDNVLVIGDGKLGLLISMVLRLTGCNLKLIGKHPDKLALFSALGGSVELPESFSVEDHSFDIVVEASGHPSGWEFALRNVRPRGTIVLKSTYHGTINFNSAPLVINEITVMGSRCGRFEPALRLIEQGLIDPTPLISDIYSINDLEEAFRRSLEKNSLKILVKMA